MIIKQVFLVSLLFRKVKEKVQVAVFEMGACMALWLRVWAIVWRKGIRVWNLFEEIWYL